MRYALNVAPVNGWETQFAAGLALLAMDGAGDATPALLGSGLVAMTLDGTAFPVTADLATGLATMELTGSSDPRVIVAQFATGQAAMELRAAHGIPQPIVTPAGFRPAPVVRQIASGDDNRLIRGGRDA